MGSSILRFRGGQPAMNNLDPKFDVSMELATLCSGNLDAPVLIGVYDFERNGRHVEMGSVQTTVSELLAMASESSSSELTLVSSGEVLDSGTVAAGTISVLKAQVTMTQDPPGAAVSGNDGDALSHQVAAVSIDESTSSTNAVAATPSPAAPTFVDYLRVGCTLNCYVAIDFTSSNGDPSHPTSLHHSGTTTASSATGDTGGDAEPQRNAYEQALRAVLTPLRPFDDDGFLPVLGFGKQMANGIVSHCFQVGKTEWSKGVEGVITSYLGTVASPNLILSGPMVLTKVLENGANRARKSLEKERKSGRLSYACFLLVANADGHVAEFEATVACLRRLRDDVPMSVIMVGIRSAGDAPDGAQPRSNSLQELAALSPDNCIYVPFQDGRISDVSKLALHELPNQIANWFLRHDIRPPPLASSVVAEEDIVVTDQED
jgi:Copine